MGGSRWEEGQVKHGCVVYSSPTHTQSYKYKLVHITLGKMTQSNKQELTDTPLH